MLYKMMNNLVAVPALDYLTLSSNNTRSNNSLKISQIQTNTDPYKYSFFPRTLCDWNKLKDDVVLSSSVDIFKNKLIKLY